MLVVASVSRPPHALLVDVEDDDNDADEDSNVKELLGNEPVKELEA